jgi:hypothetical protein
MNAMTYSMISSSNTSCTELQIYLILASKLAATASLSNKNVTYRQTGMKLLVTKTRDSSQVSLIHNFLYVIRKQICEILNFILGYFCYKS